MVAGRICFIRFKISSVDKFGIAVKTMDEIFVSHSMVDVRVIVRRCLSNTPKLLHAHEYLRKTGVIFKFGVVIVHQSAPNHYASPR